MTHEYLMGRCLVVAALAAALLTCVRPGEAQVGKVPMDVVPSTITTGLHDGGKEAVELAFQTTIEIKDATWIRLQFGDWDLGRGSFVVLTSMLDDSEQRLDAAQLEEWGGESAFFNGSGLWMQLYVAPGDQGVYADLKAVVVGKLPDMDVLNQSNPAGCGTRSPVSDPAVGRLIMSSGLVCTAWLTANSTLLTAAHCLRNESHSAVVEFNVPDSLPDGTLVHPLTDHQYPVALDSRVCTPYLQVANDWCVFLAEADPVHSQGAFLRVAEDLPNLPVDWDITIVGYGRDEGVLNHIEQSAADIYIGSYTITYEGDMLRSWTRAQSGNSGGPMLISTSDVGAAIVNYSCTSESGPPCETRTGCDPPVVGTTFKNPLLRESLNDYFGDDVLYVDDHHPHPATDGTITRPFASLQAAANSASLTRNRLFIAAGEYNEYVRISNPVKLIAPVGSVRIIGATSAWE